MKNKTLLLTITAILIIASATLVFAMPDIEYVKINGDIAEDGDQLVVEKGDTLEIRVRVNANMTEENVKVEAYIDGYEYDDYEPIRDSSETFDMDAGDEKQINLEVEIPLKAEKDYYDLKVRVGARTGASVENQFRLNLKGKRHEVVIKDILMTNQIAAGRGLFANVKVENIGQKDEKDVTVILSIPELGLEEFTTIDEIEAEDSTTSEDIVLFIDECTKAGTYDVEVTIEFDEFEKVTKTESLVVTESDVCDKTEPGQTKTIISVPSTQQVVAGQSAVFPIQITNMGKTSKTYVVTVSKAVDAFGTYRVDPTNVMIIQGQKTETVFVYLNVNKDAAEGQKDFVVTITSGDEKQDIALSANVAKGTATAVSADWKQALEIGLVVLIIILVIAGLVFGFNKLKGKPVEEKHEEELGQTYY